MIKKQEGLRTTDVGQNIETQIFWGNTKIFTNQNAAIAYANESRS